MKLGIKVVGLVRKKEKQKQQNLVKDNDSSWSSCSSSSSSEEDDSSSNEENDDDSSNSSSDDDDDSSDNDSNQDDDDDEDSSSSEEEEDDVTKRQSKQKAIKPTKRIKIKLDKIFPPFRRRRRRRQRQQQQQQQKRRKQKNHMVAKETIQSLEHATTTTPRNDKEGEVGGNGNHNQNSVDDVTVSVSDRYGEIEISMSQMTNTPEKLLAGKPRVVPICPLSPTHEEEEEEKEKEREVPTTGKSPKLLVAKKQKVQNEQHQLQNTRSKPTGETKSRRLPLPYQQHTPSTKSILIEETDDKIGVKTPQRLSTTKTNDQLKKVQPPSSTTKTRKAMNKPIRRVEVPKWKKIVEHTNIEVENDSEKDPVTGQEEEIARNRSIPRMIHLNSGNTSFESSLAPLRKLSQEQQKKKRILGKSFKNRNQNGPRFQSSVQEEDSLQAASQQQPLTMAGGIHPPKRSLALPTPCARSSPPNGSPELGKSMSRSDRLNANDSNLERKDTDDVAETQDPLRDNDIKSPTTTDFDNDENEGEDRVNDDPTVFIEMRPMAIDAKGQPLDGKKVKLSNHTQMKPRNQRVWFAPLGIKNRWNPRKKRNNVEITVNKRTPVGIPPVTVQKTDEPVETKLRSSKRRVFATLDHEGIESPTTLPPLEEKTSLGSVQLKTDGLCGHMGCDYAVDNNKVDPVVNTSTKNVPNSVTGMRKFDSLLDNDDASAQVSISAKTHASAKTNLTTKTFITAKTQNTPLDQIEVVMKDRKTPMAMLNRFLGRDIKPVKVSVASIPQSKEASTDEELITISPVGKGFVHPCDVKQDSFHRSNNKNGDLVNDAQSGAFHSQHSEGDMRKDSTVEDSAIEGKVRVVDDLVLSTTDEAMKKGFVTDSMGPKIVVGDTKVVQPKSKKNVKSTKRKEDKQKPVTNEFPRQRGGPSTVVKCEKQIIEQTEEPALVTSFGDLFGMLFQTKNEISSETIDQKKKVDKYHFDMCGAVTVDAIEDQGIEVDDNNTITAFSPATKYSSQVPECNKELDHASLGSGSVQIALVKPKPTRKGSAKLRAKSKGYSRIAAKQTDLAQVDLTTGSNDMNFRLTKEGILSPRMSEETSPQAVKKTTSIPALQSSSFFNSFTLGKQRQDQRNTQRESQSTVLSPRKEGEYPQSQNQNVSSSKRQNHLHRVLSSGDENDSMANTWAEIADASLVVERAMDRINTLGSSMTDTSRKVHDLLSLESLDTMGDDVEHALRVLRKHAKRLGVRESELLLAVKSDDYGSRDDEASVKPPTFGEELMETFNVYMNNKPRKSRIQK